MNTPRWLSPAVALWLFGAFALLAVPAASLAQPPVTPPGLGRLAMNETSGLVEGAFVSFEAPDADVVIANFSSVGVLYFDSVAVDGYVLNNKTFVGSLLKLRGTGAEAQVHDNPGTILKLTLDASMTAVFDLAANVSAASGANGSLALSVAGTNRTATAWTTCGPNATVLAEDNASFNVSAASKCFVFFRAQVLAPPSEALVTQAAEAGRLAAEIYIAPTSSDGSDVTTYGNANVVVTHTPGRVVVSVQTENGAPASVLVRFVPDESGRAVVTIDGRQATPASSLEDALDATDDGGAVEYSLHGAKDGTLLLVLSIPQPASHVVEIQSAVVPRSQDLSSSLIGVALGLAVTGAAATALFRRR